MTAREAVDDLRKIVKEVRQSKKYFFLLADPDIYQAIERCHNVNAREIDIKQAIEDGYKEAQ